MYHHVSLSNRVFHHILFNNSFGLRTTIHQSKGLEFPIVFLLGVADGLLPLTRAIDDGDVEEERRLFYVACTRAENLLYLFAPRFAVSGEGYRPLDPCRFLEEMSPDCYELADYAHRRL